MKTAALEFCKKYKEKLKIDKDQGFNHHRIFGKKERITFKVTVFTQTLGQVDLNNRGEQLMFLDQEDLDYLYNKYSKKLEEEMNENIKDIQSSYRLLLEK